MEIQFPFNFPILVLFSSFIFLLIKEWKKTKSLRRYKNLPPGPSKLPVIGHLHHLIGQLPHQAFRRLEQKYGPVVHLQLGEIPVVVIASREAAKQVVKDQDPACADRPSNTGLQIMWYNYVDMAFSPYNEYWRQMRKICVLELLSAKNVMSFGSIRQDEVSNLIKCIQISSGEVINLSEKLFALTSSIICRAVFGKVMTNQDTLISLVKRGIAMSSGFDNLADLFPSYKLFHLLNWNKYKLLRMRRKLDSILDVILEDHKLKQSGEFGEENILDVLLRIQKNKELEFPIGNNNIKAVIFDMLSGAIETSSTVIDWAMVELIRNPHLMAKLQQEIREAFEGIGEVEERRRVCPGRNFGLANIDLPLAKLLFHFNWKMPEGMTTNDIDMTESVSTANSLTSIVNPQQPAGHGRLKFSTAAQSKPQSCFRRQQSCLERNHSISSKIARCNVMPSIGCETLAHQK
ncbi:hypothetical protein RD792_005702, partial [Penstemon davidsonii]